MSEEAFSWWWGGEWRELAGATRTLRSPVDGSQLVRYRCVAPQTMAELLDVEGSKAALTSIDLSLADRCDALRQLADLLERDATQLAALITMENGCPAAQSEKLQVHSAVALLRAMADIGADFSFREERPAARGGTVRVLWHPVGLSLGIVPWNVPLFLACAKLAAALIAGCPLLLKPSPENAASMARFARHLAALPLPSYAVNLVLGDRELGAALVSHASVSKVSFTGSTAAGRAVAQACAQRFARFTLELGGKSAAILLDDVDMESVADELFLAMLQNNGQVCGAQSRILIPASREPELSDALTALFEGLRVGDPRDDDTDIGPVVSAFHARRIKDMCGRATQAGARLLGGRLDEGHAHSDAYVAPHLYADVAIDAEIWREEVFGPVVSMHSYRTIDEAVTLANTSAYGLSGSVWSADVERAATVAARLRTGTVGINSKKILDFAAPFGGWRASGIGREFGPEGIHEYLESSALLLPA